MAAESSPAFQFYVKEWRSSRPVQRMTYDQRGRYLDMLLEQWETLSLPDDPRAVADRLGSDPLGVEGWIAAWPVLRRKFCDRRGRPRKGDDVITNYADTTTWDAHRQIINVKLEDVRKQQRRYKKTAKVGGQARTKAAKRNHDGTYSQTAHPARTPAAAPAGQPATHPAVSSTPTPTPTPTPTEKKETPPTARSKRPIFRGNRLVVFEWLHTELEGLLGPHAEAFHLDEWYDDCDQRCLRDGLIPPERDNGAWLKAQTLTEARTRGIDLRAVTADSSSDRTNLATVESILKRQGAFS